ncbi:MAG: response regulator [Candidatus Aminicenantes bacterium]|nr:MAG: response regulator [Candidatus Aminicenantes bacterium]
MIFKKKYRVLVVDDDEDMLLLIEKILSGAKYKIFKASNGNKGIEEAKNILPDIIVMDIMMPELDGIAAVLKLKSINETRSIPVIMCTAVKAEEDEIVARNLGVADYIRKTPHMEGLLEKIKKVLSE